ncbi:MAG: 4-hydroxy-2-oxovalerate aldolase [Mesorhizobium amorphae]|nr:MAG: 4-hydroxy-2-oxovalerate aldolase [Mesorhizobium amorphae]
MSDFRKRCLEGEALFGTFVAIPHPVAVEVTAASGFDFLCIDCEHGQIGRETVENLVRAADVHGVPALVRVPGHGAEAVAAALDSGARGVLVPRVSTPEQAAGAVRAARFPPLGARGVGPGRAAGYGYRIPDYLARANSEIVVAVQVETVEGLRQVDAIAAVEGVDLVFVGPGDLGVSLDAAGLGGAEQLSDAVAAILRAARAAGKVAGMFCGRPEDAGRWAEAGASFFMLGADSIFLGNAASEGLKRARGG